MDTDLKNLLLKKMERALQLLDKEFSGLRTGRASTNLLDSVVVHVYGSKMPLSQLSTITTPDAKTISVQVWDKSMIKPIEKAISEANLGLQPNIDSQLIRINLPPLSETRRKELVKIAHKYAENTKITLRNIRRDGMDNLKQMEKNNSISKDEYHQYAEKIQKLIEDFINKIDKQLSVKDKEIMTI